MKRNNKGFTLAELLIVIAIIAILIAIAIPVFASQLRATRLATDHANIRSAYAWAQSANLMNQADIDGNGVIDATDMPGGGTKYFATKVYFHRDGSINKDSGATDGSNYTLQVTAKTTECQESAPCDTTNYLKDVTLSGSAVAHTQDKAITIQYLPKTITAGAGGGSSTSESLWFVIFE